MRRIRHIGRGTIYKVLGLGKIQTSAPLEDYSEVVVYCGEDDGNIWVRPIGELTEDRFENLPEDSITVKHNVLIPLWQLKQWRDQIDTLEPIHIVGVLDEINAIIGSPRQ